MLDCDAEEWCCIIVVDGACVYLELDWLRPSGVEDGVERFRAVGYKVVDVEVGDKVGELRLGKLLQVCTVFRCRLDLGFGCCFDDVVAVEEEECS